MDPTLPGQSAAPAAEPGESDAGNKTTCEDNDTRAPVESATILGIAPTTPATSSIVRSRASTAVLEPGTRIAQYELVRELGRGGMGVVYLARDVKLGRNVAMKFLKDSSREVADRFLIEARATARCSHENIVIIHEVNEVDETPYMVLEYLEGTDLRKLMGGARLPPARVVDLVLPIARALTRAHELGIIHRDLKPENVFVTTAGHVKVLDFGIAKAIANDPTRTPPLGLSPGPMMLTGAGALIGTLPYISPEQMSDGVDTRSDLWALGVIMFELLTGEHPVQPLTRDSLFQNLFDPTPMRSVLELVPGTLAPIAEVVATCLEKRKHDRLASASELVTRLEALLPSAAAITAPQPAPTTQRERARPSRRLGFAILGVAVIAIVGAMLLLLRPSGGNSGSGSGSGSESGSGSGSGSSGRSADERRLADLFQLTQRGDHVKAAPLIEDYVERHPADPDALALQLLTLWKSNGVLAKYDIAMNERLLPQQRAVVHGIALMTLRREEEAIAYLEQADLEHPDSPELVYTLGEARWHKGRLDGGVATLERAFRLDPRWQMALDHVLEYRFERGETALVKPIIELLRAADPAAAVALDCRLAIAERRYADAARNVATAIVVTAIARVEPLPDTYACQIQAHILAGDLEAAERVAKMETDRASDVREWGILALEGELLLYRGRFDEYLELTRGQPSVQRSLAFALWGSKSDLDGKATTAPSATGMRQAPISTVAWILTQQATGTLPPTYYADYPESEVSSFARGSRADLLGDRKGAIAEYRKVIATPAKGDVRMLAAHHLARALHDSGDHAGAAAACEEVFAPRVYQGYRALLLPDCQLWSEDPAQWKRLVATWRGTFEHPAVVEARRRVAN